MGNMHAQALAGSEIDADVALHVHLQSNHYPSVDPAFIPTAKAAIANAVCAIDFGRPELWDVELELPNGLVRTVADVVQGLHLDAFIDAAGDE